MAVQIIFECDWTHPQVWQRPKRDAWQRHHMGTNRLREDCLAPHLLCRQLLGVVEASRRPFHRVGLLSSQVVCQEMACERIREGCVGE